MLAELFQKLLFLLMEEGGGTICFRDTVWTASKFHQVLVSLEIEVL